MHYHTCSTGFEDSCKISVNEEYLYVYTVTSSGSFKISEKVSMDLDLAGYVRQAVRLPL